MIVHAAPATTGRRAPRAVVECTLFDDAYACDTYTIDDDGFINDDAEGCYVYPTNLLVEFNNGDLAVTTRIGLRRYCEMQGYPTIAELM